MTFNFYDNWRRTLAATPAGRTHDQFRLLHLRHDRIESSKIGRPLKGIGIAVGSGWLSVYCAMKQTNLAERIDTLFKLATEGEQSSLNAHELVQGTLSVLTAAYGPQSIQSRMFEDAVREPTRRGLDRGMDIHAVRDAAGGALRDLKASLEAGIVSSLQATVTGDVLTDHVALAKTVLAEPGEGAKNVAAVLAAAAYEDTLRRLGTINGLPHSEKLADTLTSLKGAGLLVGSQVGIANSYLKFRNDALHARWESVDRSSVSSVLGFVEQILLKHFS